MCLSHIFPMQCFRLDRSIHEMLIFILSCLIAVDRFLLLRIGCRLCRRRRRRLNSRKYNKLRLTGERSWRAATDTKNREEFTCVLRTHCDDTHAILRGGDCSSAESSAPADFDKSYCSSFILFIIRANQHFSDSRTDKRKEQEK